MADLTDNQSAQAVKVLGADSAGVEQTPVQSTANGGLHTNLRNNAGTEIGTSTTPIRTDPTGTTTQPVSGTVELGATSLAALESITVQNPSGASAVNIQDGGNSITVDGTVELGTTSLAALESITVQNPAGASAVNVQDGGNSLTVDSPQLPATLGQKAMAASLPVVIASDQSAVPIQGGNSTAVKTDGSAVTQPVSAASLPLPTGASTAALQTTGNASLASIDAGIPNALGAATTANSMPVNIASDQVVPVSVASLPLPAGAATSALQTTGNNTLASIDAGIPAALGQTTMAASMSVAIASDQGDVPVRNKDGTGNALTSTVVGSQRALDVNMASQGTNNATQPSVSQLVAGSDGTNLVPIAVDNLGRLITSSLTGFGANFSFGDLTTAATTRALVRRTTYTEQTVNAQRSIASASALDASAGTGARTVKITYLDQTGAGPYTETLTLNGTTGVNTVATNICFIEKIEVLTAGSTGSNAGIISLYAASAKGGVVIGTIAATDNQTFWSHHYIPTGKVCNITGISCGHNGTTVGSGALFTLNSKSISLVNSVEIQVSDFVRLYGQTSTFARTYSSPIKISGPSRLQTYVTPETSTSTVYRAAFDFFEP